MLYTLLGRLVWKVAKYVLRRKARRTQVPKPVLGVAAGATVALVLFILQRRSGS